MLISAVLIPIIRKRNQFTTIPLLSLSLLHSQTLHLQFQAIYISNQINRPVNQFFDGMTSSTWFTAIAFDAGFDRLAISVAADSFWGFLERFLILYDSFFFSSSLFPFLVIFIFERFCSWVISTRLRLPAQMVGKCSHQKSIPEKEGKKVMNKVRNGKKEIRRRRRRKTDIKTRWRS